MSWFYLSIVILSDQLTKLWAVLSGPVSYNQGVSFGWLANWPNGVLTVIWLLALILMWRLYQSLWLRYQLIAALFWGGAISNLIDRLLFGSVVDWLHLPGLSVTNNIADVAISLGLLGLLIKEIGRYGRRYFA